MASEDTRNRIMDAAERLFADEGFGHVSLRQIIAQADVNLAAIHYHFGSKESLLEAILSRRIGPINEERLKRLDELESASGRRSPALKDILHALVAPPLRLSRDRKRGGEVFVRLLGRTFTEPNEAVQKMLLEQFRSVANRFIPALQKALPGVPPEDFFWRFHFMIGSMAHTMAHAQHLGFISNGQCNPTDTEGIIHRLVEYSQAGLKASVSKALRGKGGRS